MLTGRSALPLGIATGLLIAVLGDPAAGQTITSPTSSGPSTLTPLPGSPPPSAIGAPMNRLGPLAPLSPQITTTPLTGGTVRTDRLPSPSASSGSPSELAQSTAGGGGRTLEDCVKFWDRDTHMTKSEWRTACQRSQQRLDNLKIESLNIGLDKNKR